MKKLRTGLIVEGNSTSSAILRLKSVAQELGPVKSGSLQVARRVSNALRAGYAVTSYEELAAARLIIIKVPDGSVPRVVRELCASSLSLDELSFVLCETWLQSAALQPLRDRGAFTASMVSISEKKRGSFAVEGDTPAARQIRRIVERGEIKTVELRGDSKHLLYAAMVLMTSAPISLLVAAQQALRESGISGNQVGALLEDLASGTVSSFLRTPKATTPVGSLADCSRESADAYLVRLTATHPDLANRLTHLLSAPSS